VLKQALEALAADLREESVCKELRARLKVRETLALSLPRRSDVKFIGGHFVVK
jgi:hypothetical protein